MKTKVGTHFHIFIGPEEVNLYDVVTFPGHYYNLIIDDVDIALETFTKLINFQIPDYLDDDEVEEMSQFVYEAADCWDDEGTIEVLSIYEDGFEMGIGICNNCSPVITN